jgi:hypothetical protein
MLASPEVNLIVASSGCFANILDSDTAAVPVTATHRDTISQERSATSSSTVSVHRYLSALTQRSTKIKGAKENVVRRTLIICK